jgi:pimeloyl-ACP methyl ester carboxylesterase
MDQGMSSFQRLLGKARQRGSISLPRELTEELRLVWSRPGWIVVWLSVTMLRPCPAGEVALPTLSETRIPSTADGVRQPLRYWAPDSAVDSPTPLLVSLHSWSTDYRQDRSDWLREAVRYQWVYVQPNFRGVNDHPEACGSPLARQDVLDAVAWACRQWRIDGERIYLAGVSGGGHMTMMMAASHPDRFSAASAWVGPTDLAEWYRFHSRGDRPERYARMIAACCGGPPGTSPEVDAEYRARSPVFHLGGVGDLHLDLNTGVKDGITGSVPIHHTLRAYNTVALAHGSPVIPEAEMDELWREGRLSRPLPADTLRDPTYGREILLRRNSGHTRVTVFDGTHEALPAAACAWLASKRRATTAAAVGPGSFPRR